MNSMNQAGELKANENFGAELSMDELAQIAAGGFWSQLGESVGRFAEGLGVVTGSIPLVVIGGAMY